MVFSRAEINYESEFIMKGNRFGVFLKWDIEAIKVNKGIVFMDSRMTPSAFCYSQQKGQ